MDVENLEQQLPDLWDPAVEPLADECLGHYLCRVLEVAGCRNDHRFTRLWAARRRRCDPRALVRWAGSTGGCCCDCEVVFNSLRRRSASRRAGVMCEAARSWQSSLRNCWDLGGDAWPEACSGVTGTVPRQPGLDLTGFA